MIKAGLERRHPDGYTNVHSITIQWPDKLIYVRQQYVERASQVALVVRNSSANADVRDVGLSSGSDPLGSYWWDGHGNLLQYSCLENSMDRGAQCDTVHGVAKIWTRLRLFSMHASMWKVQFTEISLLCDKPRQNIKKQTHHFETKVHIVKAMILPVVMYRCESWTVKKAESRRTDAFKSWC